jgi:hypothetical protein
MAGFPFDNIQKALGRPLAEGRTPARHVLSVFLVLLLCSATWRKAQGRLQVGGRCAGDRNIGSRQVRYETVGAGCTAGIPSECTWQFGLAQCANPIYHCIRAPRLVAMRGEGARSLI